MEVDHYEQALVRYQSQQTTIDSLPAPKIQNEFRPVCWRFLHELPHCLFHSMHTQPVSAVDDRRSSLGLFDEVTEEMRLRVINHLDASLGYNAAVIRLQPCQYNRAPKLVVQLYIPPSPRQPPSQPWMLTPWLVVGPWTGEVDVGQVEEL